MSRTRRPRRRLALGVIILIFVALGLLGARLAGDHGLPLYFDVAYEDTGSRNYASGSPPVTGWSDRVSSDKRWAFLPGPDRVVIWRELPGGSILLIQDGADELYRRDPPPPEPLPEPPIPLPAGWLETDPGFDLYDLNDSLRRCET